MSNYISINAPSTLLFDKIGEGDTIEDFPGGLFQPQGELASG